MAEGARLESVYTARYPGFESLSLRQPSYQQLTKKASVSNISRKPQGVSLSRAAHARALGLRCISGRPVCGVFGGWLKAKATYTVREVAELTGFSRQTITRMLETEKGVLVLSRPESLHKRSYRSIRMPREIYERVVRRISVRLRNY